MNKSICFVIPGWVTKHTGGAELQCYLISEELLKRGWEVEVLTAQGAVCYENYLNDKISYYYLKNFKINLIRYIRAIILLFKTKSDYYYIRTDDRLLRGALVLFAALKKKKIVYALAHDDDAKNISYLFSLSKSKKHLLKKIFRFIDLGLVDLFANRSIFRVDKIIAQSSQQQLILKKHTNLDSVIINNSFKFTPAFDKKENIVIWVANMRPFKRPEIFINLAKKFENSGWKFLMIGKSSAEFNNLISDAQSINNFEYIGSLSYKEANKWFAKSKILVNTSTVEGFSNTFLQAWFYEVALVSLAVNPNNILTKGNTGYYANDNMLELENIIRNLMDDYFEFSKNQIINGKKYLMNNFDLDKNVDKLIDVIKEL